MQMRNITNYQKRRQSKKIPRYLPLTVVGDNETKKSYLQTDKFNLPMKRNNNNLSQQKKVRFENNDSISFTIKNKKAKLFYKIEIPENFKRDQIGKIMIPKTASFKINDFFDGNFTNIINSIRFSTYDEAYIINLRNLPSSNTFLIIFEGDIESNLLNRLIRIQPAMIRDSTDTYDKYWLDVMIRDIEILEKIYESLNVNEINCSVKVGVERFFTTELPSSLKEGISALNNFLSVGRESNRIKLFSAWMRYRRSVNNVDKEELENFFRDLAKKFYLKDYIEIDPPFYLGEISSHEVEKIV
ncbi:hypothetical protein LCGC14_3106310, partial [marine sediment metagenome]